MINNYSNIEDLIAKHLAGETSGDENALLTKWLNESEANKKYFETLEKIFFESAALKNDALVDTDAAWNKLKKEIKRSEAGSQQSDEKNNLRTINNIKLFLRIAAAVVFVVLSITVYRFYFRDSFQTVNLASAGETKTVMLPDSSTVFMNKHTTLAYNFTDEKREITLTGEAFFDVKHDERKPFIISLNDLKIEDIGTSFNVKAQKSSDSVEIIVASGIVKLTAAINQDYNYNFQLKPGQQAVYNKKTKRITQSIAKDTNALAYRTKIFVFENASLTVVAQKLSEVYGTEIFLGDHIKNCHITATFKNEKIESIMDVIASTLNISLTKNENKYILEGDGCEE